MRGWYRDRRQDSSIGGDAGYVCLGVVHMKEEVQDRVQVEVGRKEQGVGEKQSSAHHGWHEGDMSACCTDTFSGSS